MLQWRLPPHTRTLNRHPLPFVCETTLCSHSATQAFRGRRVEYRVLPNTWRPTLPYPMERGEPNHGYK